MAIQRFVKRCVRLSLACRLLLLGLGVLTVCVLVSLHHASLRFEIKNRFLQRTQVSLSTEGKGIPVNVTTKDKGPYVNLTTEHQGTGKAVADVSTSVPATANPQRPDHKSQLSTRKIDPTKAVTEVSNKDVKKFQVLVEGADMEILLTVVDAFTEAMRQANVSFFLYSGSLVGSWRHHGLVPWDDDVDFVFSSALRPVAEQALKKLAPTFQLSTTQKVRWKVFFQDSPRIKAGSSVDWSWPFLDISFYEENSTHIWDMDKHFRTFVYKKSDVFPLTQRPFQGRLLPAPKNTSAVLSQTYDLEECRVTEYNHRTERGINRENFATVKCDRLRHLFPFVVRKTSPWEGGGCSETLQKNGTTVTCCFVDNNVREC